MHDFQNLIEQWLFAANLALVGLGTIYTALVVNGEASAGVEAVCMALLVCSLLASAGFMVRRSRQMHLARRKLLATASKMSSGACGGGGGRGCSSASDEDSSARDTVVGLNGPKAPAGCKGSLQRDAPKREEAGSEKPATGDPIASMLDGVYGGHRSWTC